MHSIKTKILASFLIVIVCMSTLLVAIVFNYNNLLNKYEQINSNIVYEQALKDAVWRLVENLYNDFKTGDFSNYEKELVEIRKLEAILDNKTNTNKDTHAAYLGVKNSLEIVIKDASKAKALWEAEQSVTSSSTFFQESEKNFSFVKTNISDLILSETKNIAEVTKQIQERQLILSAMIAVFSFVVIAFSLVLSLFFASKITSPIKSLSKTAEGISGGNLNLNVESDILKIKDETGSLANSFNYMIAKLRKDRSQLEKFKLALDVTSEHIVLTDIDGKIVYANKAVEKMTGYSHEEIIGNNPSLWGGKENPDIYKDIIETILSEKKPFEGEMKNARKDGQEYFTRVTVCPLTNKDQQKITGFVGIEQDITESKKYEQRLIETVKKSTSELRASIDALANAYVLIGKDGKIALTNHNLDKLLGKTEGGWTVEKLHNKLSPEYDFKIIWQDVLINHKNITSPDLVWQGKILEIRVNPVFSLEEKDQLLGVLVMLSDITEERQLARSKDEFFSIASHELRTPLTAIRGNTSLIQQMYLDKISDPDFSEMIEDIHQSSIRLIGIVNDFLNVSRLEVGKLEFKNAAFDIVPLTSKVIEELQNEAVSKGLSLAMESNASPIPNVFADQDRLKEVLINLIGNSIKYTDSGKITLSFEVNSGKLKGLITDTGRGISSENQTLLFHKFQQASSSLLTRDTSKGTGLGLYIAKLMVEGMGGQLALEKSEIGVGSTFSFTLPIVS